MDREARRSTIPRQDRLIGGRVHPERSRDDCGICIQVKIATVVGAPTPGQLLGAANFRVGGDYRLRIPLTAWYMWDGELIEGKGVVPDHEVKHSLEDLRAGKDVQMERAVNVILSLNRGLAATAN